MKWALLTYTLLWNEMITFIKYILYFISNNEIWTLLIIQNPKDLSEKL